MLKQSILLVLASVVISFAVNYVSPHGISPIGEWRDLSSGDGPIIPPDPMEGDPPFIDINRAQMEHTAGIALFVDARTPEEFECGTIPEAVNLSFDYLPEYDLGPYFDSVLNVPKNHPLIVFCSGEECESSLHLGRNLQEFGYTSVLVFFGGAREWETLGFEMERRAECGE
jgi:rhodanese-related sulfurtransferase